MSCHTNLRRTKKREVYAKIQYFSYLLNMSSIQNKLAIIIVIGLLVTTSLTAFIIYKYETLIDSVIHLSNETGEVKDSAYSAQIYFKTQIQEWKNILLRGYDKNLYMKYYNSFLLYENRTTQEVQGLIVLARKYPELNKSAKKFIKEHKKLSALYREGLTIYNQVKDDPQISADKNVRGIDREPIKLLAHIVKLSEKIYKAEEINIKTNIKRMKYTVSSTYIVTIILLTVFYWFSIKKGITQPLKKNNLRNHQLAMTDGLTNIANRHSYNDRISYEIERCHLHRDSLALLLFDIDKFKSVNDNYGHKAGDEVIRGTAQILKNNIRKNDFVARYGGEEFIVLLPSSDINTGESIANKLRKIIWRNVYSFNNEQVVITISVGIAEIKINETMDDLFERADKALYKAKESGRNMCVKA